MRPLNARNTTLTRIFKEHEEPMLESNAEPAEPETPTTESVLEKLVLRLAELQTTNTLTPDQLESIMTRAGITSADAMRISLKPENADHPHISVFFTERDRDKYGSYENKPVLKRKTFFCGVEEKEERLTPAEIEAYNRLDGTHTARFDRWVAEVRRNGLHEELHVTLPVESVDDRMNLPPSLLLCLRELEGGEPLTDIEQLIRQRDYLKQQVLDGGRMNAVQLEKALLNQ